MPAAAQTMADDNDPTVGVTFGILKFGGFSSDWGIDGKYSSATMTEPVTPLGFRAGFSLAAGVHGFGDTTLKLLQGGVHLTADELGTPKLQMYGDVLFGFGNFFDETNPMLTLAVGADVPLENQPFKIRIEVAQVWDFFDGGSNAGWRFSGGIAYPLR